MLQFDDVLRRAVSTSMLSFSPRLFFAMQLVTGGLRSQWRA
jgi:hypothetical protein